MSRNQRNKRLSDVSLALLEVSSLPQVEKSLSDPDEDTATPRTCRASLKRRGSGQCLAVLEPPLTDINILTNSWQGIELLHLLLI